MSITTTTRNKRAALSFVVPVSNRHIQCRLETGTTPLGSPFFSVCYHEDA
jgi:hypothetical protein